MCGVITECACLGSGVFAQSTEDVTLKYTTPFTPAPWALFVWDFTYVWIFAMFIYFLVGLCRRQAPCIIPRISYIQKLMLNNCITLKNRLFLHTFISSSCIIACGKSLYLVQRQLNLPLCSHFLFTRCRLLWHFMKESDYFPKGGGLFAVMYFSSR